jgi:hypothetical protein
MANNQEEVNPLKTLPPPSDLSSTPTAEAAVLTETSRNPSAVPEQAEGKTLNVSKTDFDEFTRLEDFTFQLSSKGQNTQEFHKVKKWLNGRYSCQLRIRIADDTHFATGRALICLCTNYNIEGVENATDVISVTARMLGIASLKNEEPVEAVVTNRDDSSVKTGGF